jgi:tRNA uridine 5-carboxymethylaminomethyl modification enzyme
LISDERYQKVVDKISAIDREIERLKNTNIGANKKVQEFLESNNSTPLKSGTTLAELIKRPELNYDLVASIDENRMELAQDVREQVNINLKYEGYIKRQSQQVHQFKKMEGKKLDPNFDYSQIQGLRREAIQKLNLYKPLSIGQASRISGVSPADIAVLTVYLKQNK